MKEYDIVVLGAGPGGYVAAIRAAQLGMSTAIVEKRETLGGTCLNIGCIPSKALLDSSELYARAAGEAEAHGIGIEGLSLNVPKMLARKQSVVDKLTGGVAMLVKANKIDVHAGWGWIEDAHTIQVRGENDDVLETIRCKNLLIATGSVPIELPFLPLDGKTVVDSTGALEFGKVPKHLLIVGGGVIGLELGSVWARLGAKVTVVELLPQIMAGWDDGIAKAMKRELGKQGFEFILQSRVTDLAVKRGKATLTIADAAGEAREISGDKVLVAVGRRPMLEGFNLETLGVNVEKGRIVVDDHYRSSVNGVLAVGDVVTGPMLAHKAEDEGIVAVERLAGVAGHVNYDAVPNVIYTWPEAASVGKTENELKEAGIEYRAGSFPFAANGRAIAMGATAGFVKVLADAATDRLLGAHIVGPWASDLIAEFVSVIEFGGSAEDIARTVHAHPTLPEAVKEAALGVDGRMIHAKN